MQSGRPQGLPLEGHVEGVIGEDCFPVVVALVKADTPAIPQIYGRYYLYFRPLSITDYEGIIALGLNTRQLVMLVMVVKLPFFGYLA
jgi:hypothetical protein